MPHVNEVIYGICSVVIWAIGARSVKTPDDAMEQITVMYCSCAAKDGRRVESSKELVGSQNPVSVARPGTLSNDGSALDQ